MSWIWPLLADPLLPDNAGSFGALRRFDRHTGVDLYCEVGTPVVAVERGLVVNIEPFTGEKAGSSWWCPTDAVLVEGASGVVVYGEVTTGLKVGASVEQGDIIGYVAPVLQRFKGRPMVMLHLELMRSGARATGWWRITDQPPGDLLDPTPLLPISPNTPEFNLLTYDHLKFRYQDK